MITETTQVGYPPPREPATPDAIHQRTLRALLPDLETATEDDLLDLAHNCCVNDDDRWVLLGSDAHVRAMLSLIDRLASDQGALIERISNQASSIRDLEAMLGTESARLAIAQGLAGRREKMMLDARDAHQVTTLELEAARANATRFDDSVMRLSMQLVRSEQLRIAALEDATQLRTLSARLSQENHALRIAMAEIVARAQVEQNDKGE